MKIQISAPGKTILHGEYAAVFKEAAVAVSIGLRTNVHLVSNEKELILNLKTLNAKKIWNLNMIDISIFKCDAKIQPLTEEISTQISSKFELLDNLEETEKCAMLVFLYLWIFINQDYNKNHTFPPYIVDVESQLIPGSGTGSSASYSVCMSAALLLSCGAIDSDLTDQDKELINKWAFEAEKVFHGKPSGVDNSICTFGGAVLFDKGVIFDTLPKLADIPILLVNTKASRNTKLLVESVKKKRESNPTVLDSIMAAIGAISRESWDILKKLQDSSESLKTIEDLIFYNHHLLQTLDVGHSHLDIIHSIAKKHGLASKFTGAGGGGCAFILLSRKGVKCDSSTVRAIEQEFESFDFDVHELVLGSRGVQVELFEN